VNTFQHHRVTNRGAIFVAPKKQKCNGKAGAIFLFYFPHFIIGSKKFYGKQYLTIRGGPVALLIPPHKREQATGAKAQINRPVCYYSYALAPFFFFFHNRFVCQHVDYARQGKKDNDRDGEM